MHKTALTFMALMTALIGFHCESNAAEIIRTIPVAEGLAAHPVNGGHCFISDGTHQYLAFYDGEHQATVAKRKLGGEHWEFAKLPERVEWDTHNKLVLFIDNKGYLHLTGNMHNDPLNYYRTQKPRDIQTFEAIHRWAGFYEERVTYPSLFKQRDGRIHMMYRHGGSGNGMRLLAHYNDETQEWTGTGKSFISGMDREPTCNAYPFGILEVSQGNMHIAWCWRETPDVLTNFDVCYAKSLDGGVTWRRLDGSVCPQPITPETADVAESIKQNSGLMNGGSFALDQNDHPYIGFTRFDENGHNQLFAATDDDGQWRVVQITDWDQRFWFEGRGSIPAGPPTPRISIDGDNRLRIRYSFSMVEPRSGEIMLTRDELLALKPGEAKFRPASESGPAVPNLRASCSGPLPKGESHYMTQAVDRANRDRKPDNPKAPTMIYVVEVKE